jgi:hypothetical protein
VCSNHIDRCWSDGVHDAELVSRRRGGGGVEPDDPSFVVLDFSRVVIVRREMPVDGRVGMVSIRFVEVLWSEAARDRQPRGERERKSRAPQRMHAP